MPGNDRARHEITHCDTRTATGVVSAVLSGMARAPDATRWNVLVPCGRAVRRVIEERPTTGNDEVVPSGAVTASLYVLRATNPAARNRMVTVAARGAHAV